MIYIAIPKHYHRKELKRQKGVALILALSTLVLISVLVLAIIASVGTLSQNSKAAANNSATRALVDDSIQLVTAQIRDATTLDQTKSWASQPGMIRTYDTGGNASNFYKLYSSPDMVVDGSTFSVPTEVSLAVPSDWDTKPAQFTDLNSPVNNVYPVVDPTAWSGTPNKPPIPNTGWNGSTDVQGFSYSAVPPSGGASIHGVTPGSGLPMPCQWLYVRKSGFVAAATGTGNGTVTVPADPNNPSTAANPNPIVGRIAFWTDDDTCKVNINTACGDLWSPDNFSSSHNSLASNFHTPGSYWVVPRFSTLYDEWNLSAIMPLKHEFQRYPGHPSTVYLSAVFPQFSASGGSANGMRDALYSLIPRVNGGTSDPTPNTEGGSALPSSVQGGSATVLPKHDRLYASIDELLYAPSRTSNPVITPLALEKAKFFITADSKAPELNLFNLPRISMWPIDYTYSFTVPASNSSRYTAYDQLIAYCSSLGATAHYPYFFQRERSSSPTFDWDPFGSGRNPALYKYLQRLVNSPVPGYGGSLGQKYNQAPNGFSESDQILTEIMDYIRCINLQDPLLNPSNQFAPTTGMVLPLQPPNGTMGFGRFMTISEVGLQFVVTDVSPAVAPPAMPTTETVQAIVVLEGHAVSSCFPFTQISGLTIVPTLPNNILPGKHWTVQQGGGSQQSLLFSNPNPIKYYSPFSTTTVFSIGAEDSVISPYFPSSDSKNTGTQSNGSLPFPGFATDRNSNPTPGYAQAMTLTSALTMQIPTTTNTAAQKFNFNAPAGTPLTLKIYANGATGTLVQTLSVDFSSLNGTWMTPTPDPGITASLSHTTPPTTTPRTLPDTIGSTDSLKTMVPGYPQIASGDRHAGGDYRLIAGLKTPPSTLWVAEGGGDPLNNAGTAIKQPLSHNFTDDQLFTGTGGTGSNPNSTSRPSNFPGYTQGSLIDVDYNIAGINNIGSPTFGWGDVPAAPQTNSSLRFKTEFTHDFDQGAGISADGAFINHPEEVSVSNLGTGANQTPYFANYVYDLQITGTTSNAGGTSLTEFSSPNRLVPSPGILGSLPTRVAEGIPWQTLLFRAQPDHPGSGGFGGLPGTAAGFASNASATIQSPPYSVVPDHLFLDLFWMPQVEPYAISDTFSTSGKVNMNYQIMPFTYIDRATGMEAVLRSQRMAAIPSNEYVFSKGQFPDNGLTGSNDPRLDFRHDLNLSTGKGGSPAGGTLMQFENKFDSGDIFRSASQICDIYMVPLGQSWGALDAPGTVEAPAYTWWNNTPLTFSSTTTDTASASLNGPLPSGYKLTGDNTREEPYTNIYSLLTTKSNSYTVHMRVQSLQQANTPNRDYTKWNDPAAGGTDVITGEYRGSASIERYLDQSDPNLQNTDFATASVGNTSVSLSPYYKYRVTSTKQFAP